MSENSYFFRLYFSTHQHVYVLPYQRLSDTGNQTPSTTQTIEFVRPLTEMPFTGVTWTSIVDRTGDHIVWPLLYVPRRYAPYELGQIEWIYSQDTRLPVNNILLIRPSHTTPEIAALVQREGQGWYVSAIHRMQLQQEPFPLSSLEPQQDEQGQPLYDVFGKPAGWWEEPMLPLLRLPFEQAREAAQAIISNEGGLLLRYDEAQDTLEWLNASYLYYDGLITDIDDPANRQIPSGE